MTDLPIHPRTGLTAVGIVGGRPVWPIMGASPDDPSNEGQPAGGETGASGQGGAPQGGGTGQPSGGQQGGAQPPAPAQQPPAPAPAPDAPGQTFSAEYVKQLRDEAAGYRTQLRTVEGERDEARKALTPAQEAAQTRALELAVVRTAPGKGANPDALLDSLSFKQAVSKLDPSAADFGTALEAAITSAIESNTSLRAAPGGPRRSGGAEFTGGAGGSNGERPKNLRAAFGARNR